VGSRERHRVKHGIELGEEADASSLQRAGDVDGFSRRSEMKKSPHGFRCKICDNFLVQIVYFFILI
jgi:hypothetical protein